MMFSKSDATTSAPPVAPRENRNAGKSVLGADLTISGELVSSGAIEILGKVEGNISADSLSLGENGVVNGSIRANAVEVKGTLDGTVDCQSFTMRASARVTADILYKTLMIESGAQIEGRLNKSA